MVLGSLASLGLSSSEALVLSPLAVGLAVHGVHGVHAGVHLSKLPLGQGDARLLVDGGHERREHLVHVTHDLGLVALAGASAAVAAGARVPDANLGLQATDGLGVGLGQLDVGALLNHEVLQQALGPTESGGQLGVGVGHGGHTLGLAQAAHDVGLGDLLGGIVLGLGLGTGLEGGGVGGHLLGLLVGTGVGLDLVSGGVGLLLLTLTVDGGLDDVAGTETLHLGGGALDFDLALEVLVLGLEDTLGRDLGDLDIAGEAGLPGLERGLGGGALNVTLRLLDGRFGVDLGNLTVLLTLALGLTNVTEELGVGDIDTGLVGGTLVGLAGERLKVDGVGGVLEFLLCPVLVCHNLHSGILG
jgi:hypothetical protein